MVLDKLKSLVNKEEYSPATLFEVKNMIGDESGIDIPEKSPDLSVEEQDEKDLILGFVIKSGGRIGAGDLLSYCTSNDICSRATFFRKVKELIKEDKLKRVKEGRKSFYLIKEDE